MTGLKTEDAGRLIVTTGRYDLLGPVYTSVGVINYYSRRRVALEEYSVHYYYYKRAISAGQRVNTQRVRSHLLLDLESRTFHLQFRPQLRPPGSL